MAEIDVNGFNLKTVFGEVGAKGPIVIIVVVVFAVGGLSIWEHGNRSREHHEILTALHKNRDTIVEALKNNDCLNALAIYQGLQPRGTINWGDMPTDLYPCIPKFMTDKGGK